MAARQVRALLMGGQACVFYGAAEFSRDTDLLILAEISNLERLRAALDDLQAECIAVPPFQLEFLLRGHAVHFRCQHPEAAGMRVDVMCVLRGVDPFPIVWERRTTLREADGTIYELLSLPDLVQAKKTQRDKDWPMLRRLLEADYLQRRAKAELGDVRFWLRQMRTAELLVELASEHTDLCHELTLERPLLEWAALKNIETLSTRLAEEEKVERERDRDYWKPLKAELDKLRRDRLLLP